MARTSFIFVAALLPAVCAGGESTAPTGPQLPAGSGREIAARSQPYGIAVLDGIVWYSESGVSPNTRYPGAVAWCAT
jgi:hypothetical protein